MRDTVWMIQKGGLANPSITLSPQTLTLEAAATSGSAAVSTNLTSDWKDVVWEVEYTDGDPDWITSVNLTATSLGFSLTQNTGSAARKAVISVSHTDAEDTVLKASLLITQNPA